LSELTVPEIEGRRFDLICLFSVFTHMVPDDYIAMLRLLRRFVKPMDDSSTPSSSTRRPTAVMATSTT